MRRVLQVVVAVACLGEVASRAQMRVTPIDQLQGHVALGLALRHLANTGIFMMATAHPDDENNALLVMLNRGRGYRTALATATRGNGGQNEIGPELFEALGVLRTEELAAIHRFDGAEQYFARAVDFGFSFSIEETFEKWGRNEILGDYVRLIRTIRPDVITGLTPTGSGGGQHHQASAVLAHEAFKAAGDATKFPEQVSAGLRPWQPRKFYSSGQGLAIDLNVSDRLLGKSYAELGAEARSMHKCQGMAQLLSLPGPSSASYRLAESTLAGGAQRPDNALFDGIDTSINGLAQFAGARPPKPLTEALAAVALAVQTAQRQFDTVGDDAVLQPLLTGLRAVRSARGQLDGLPIDDNAKFEIRYRLLQKEREFQQAILLAGGIHLEALADDGVVTPGQQVRVTLIVANRGAADVAVRQVKFDGFAVGAPCALQMAASRGRGGEPSAPAGPPVSALRRDQVGQCAPTLTIPVNARVSEPYWHRDGEAGRYTFDDDAPFGLPYRPTPFYVQVTFGFPGIPGAEEVFGGLTVSSRYEGDIFGGEKRSELLVVPATSVRVSPPVAILPFAPPPPPPSPSPAAGRGAGRGAAGRGAAAPAPGGTTAAPQAGRGAPPAAGRGRGAAVPAPVVPASTEPTRDIRVTLVNNLKGESESTVRLTVPSGWTATPASQTVRFAREDESQTVRFQLKAAPGTPVGAYEVAAAATAGDAEFTRGYQVIEYPHIRRQHLYHQARTAVKVIDVKTAPNLTVGYIMGVGDEVPAALEQLGAKGEQIGPEDLAWGDLARFQTIVTGVRAYERRADLRANNSRLLDYVRDGGTLIVQYNKFEFNDAQYGPYTATVSSDRTTDEFAPVTVLVPLDPVFNTPNKLTDAVWSDWVQERGLYYIGEHDSRYRELVSLEEPFPNNAGEKGGALLSAQYGKGRWVYVGLGLWRQLPAGVPGAYQLMANLISLGH